jgi:hypothetical protein
MGEREVIKGDVDRKQMARNSLFRLLDGENDEELMDEWRYRQRRGHANEAFAIRASNAPATTKGTPAELDCSSRALFVWTPDCGGNGKRTSRRARISLKSERVEVDWWRPEYYYLCFSRHQQYG